MRIIVLFLPAVLAASSAGSAYGEETERYRLEKTETGYVRMDTSTGEMSICEERDSQLVCKTAVEERAAFQDEIDRLQTKLDGLEQRVVNLENRAVPEALLPSEEQFDRSMDFMEKFFRRFMDIAKDLDKDNPATLPQKT